MRILLAPTRQNAVANKSCSYKNRACSISTAVLMPAMIHQDACDLDAPRMRPSGAVVRPRTMCWSEPQMLVASTFSTTAWFIFLPLTGCASCVGARSVGH